MSPVSMLITPVMVATPAVRSSPRPSMGNGLPMTKRTSSPVLAKGLSITARPQPADFDLALDMASVMDFGLAGKAVLQRVFSMAKDLNNERSKNAQLARENAALKAKVMSMQLSVAQAESANAGSADLILRLQAEVSSAAHKQRLSQGADFMAVRKEARNLSARVGDLTMELRKVTAERDHFKNEALACTLTSIYDTPFTPVLYKA